MPQHLEVKHEQGNLFFREDCLQAEIQLYTAKETVQDWFRPRVGKEGKIWEMAS